MIARIQRNATSNRPSIMWRGTSEIALPLQKRRPRVIMTSPMRPTTGWAADAVRLTPCGLPLRRLRVPHACTRRVGRLITQQPPEDSADGEPEPLHEHRRGGEPDR